MTTTASVAGLAPATAADGTDVTATSSRRASLAKEIVLGVVGVIGLLAIAWLVCAWLFGLSVIVFKTGSMAPAIPAGGASISREIPASEVAVGDVITVQRDTSALPISHRVVSVDTVPGQPQQRSVVLQGDANATPDLEPYVIEKTRVVVASAPGAGTALALLRSPFALAVTTLVVALLVVWAFWPQRRDDAPVALPAEAPHPERTEAVE